MIPEPLHPAIVHFPIVLVVMLPLLAVAALIRIRRGQPARRAWTPVVLTALALAGSAWIAVRTGEAEEDAVEQVVAGSQIHEHEQAAELFLPLSAAVLGLVTLGLAAGRLGTAVRGAATLASLLLVIAGYRVGHTGGDLVYEHGAAAAYVTPSIDAGPVGSHDDDRRNPGEERRRSD